MKRYRAVLGMRSPLARPLTAERLFGHVCWGLALREGPEAVGDFLARMGSDNPPLVLGEPAPMNFVAMPVVLQDGRIVPDVAGKRLNLWNRYRRAGLMPRAALLKAAANLTATGVREALDASGWPRPVRARRDVRVRSAANRLDGTPAGRNDWLAVETWPEVDGGHLEVVIASGLESAEIERLLRLGLEHGVGRAASAGYGHMELVAVEPLDWPEVSGADALVTLGPCVPKRGDPAGGAWQVQTHWGRLGGTFATEGIAVEKRPVMGLKAGAVLTAGDSQQRQGRGTRDEGQAVAEEEKRRRGEEEQQRDAANDEQQRTGGQAASGTQGLEAKVFVGRLVAGVHPLKPEVVHYGLAPVVAAKYQ
jgi:hypothetical protein